MRIGEALRSARVGGEFWARGAGGTGSARIVFRSSDRLGFVQLTRALLAAHDAASLHALLPDARWARAAASRLKKTGAAVTLGPVDPWSVIDAAETVCVDAGDELGLLAALAGVDVDWRIGPRPAGPAAGRSLEGGDPLDWAHYELVDRVAYFEPFDGRPSTCEATIEVLGEWRRQIHANRAVASCVGVAKWKRREVRQLLFRGDRDVSFHARAPAAVRAAVARGEGVAVWPSRAPRGLEARAQAAGAPLIRIEDGFIRSAGLGCNLWPPASLAVDAAGLHCDPSAPSDLERILAETEFTPELLVRAQRLIGLLIDLGVTKYNLAGPLAARPHGLRRVALVIGQVRDDLSMVLGGGPGADNLDLLRRVREREPASYVIYRPHPDVMSGHRRGRIDERAALDYADVVLADVSMPSLLGVVDAVHTFTSLAGFEALLRGREVIVHGQPFYSGWGLTTDLAPLGRRRRRLTLAELVAGALIVYPRYIDPNTGALCPPEVLAARLAQARPNRAALLPWLMSLHGQARNLAGQAGLAG